MATLTHWTWIWASSGSWWWTGKPGMLHSMGSQRVGHDWVTELKWLKCELWQRRIMPSLMLLFHAMSPLEVSWTPQTGPQLSSSSLLPISPRSTSFSFSFEGMISPSTHLPKVFWSLPHLSISSVHLGHAMYFLILTFGYAGSSWLRAGFLVAWAGATV